MNRHLSIFKPYQQDGHENQLTRAALLTMKLVPLAHNAFLDLVGAARLDELPPPRFDTQTSRPVVPDESEPDEYRLNRVASIFLGPHESLPTAAEIDLNSTRRACYDGVVQYGSDLLVLIESKLSESASDWQSVALNLGGFGADKSERRLVSWQKLLGRWWNLTERDLLSPSERVILNDFFDLAEENFAWLLPFNELARCGEDASRRLRRLRSVLGEATGLEAELAHRMAQAMFDRKEVIATQRVGLLSDDNSLLLRTWPAELKPQAGRTYGRKERVEALVELGAKEEWSLRPTFYIAYNKCAPSQRWSPNPTISGAEYVRQWHEDLDAAGGLRRERLESPEFSAWLVKRGYARPEDLPGIERLLATKVQTFHVRPSIQVTRRWAWPDAVALDSQGRLGTEVRTALNEVLEVLGETPLSPQPSSPTG